MISNQTRRLSAESLPLLAGHGDMTSTWDTIFDDTFADLSLLPEQSQTHSTRVLDDCVEKTDRYSIKGSKEILPPINQLPPELLGEIFLCCVGEKGACIVAPSRLFHLGVVCQHWRSIFLSDRRLWAKFQITSGITEENLCRNLQRFLKRSGSYPLTFHFQPVWIPNLSAHHPSLEMLIAHCDRWEDVALSEDWYHAPVRDRSQLAKRGFSSLHTLSIESRPLRGSCDLFEIAPRLRRLSLKGCDDPTRRISVPWSQITVLTIQEGIAHFPIGDIMQILRFVPRIREFEWVGSGTTNSLQPLELRYLQVIRITANIHLLVAALQMIIAPQLISLRLAAEPISYRNPEIIVYGVRVFFGSSDKIKTLSLGSIEVETAMQVLKEAPASVENVEMHSISIRPEIIDQLVWIGHGIPCHVPNMRTLLLARCDLIVSELINVIRSRISKRPCLTCVSHPDSQCSLVAPLRQVILRELECMDFRKEDAEAKLRRRFGNIPGFKLYISWSPV